MRLKDVEEFKCFLRKMRFEKISEDSSTHHFKTKRTVNHEQNEVGNLANVDHTVEVVVAFNESEPPLLSTDNSNGTLGFIQRLFCIPPDETFEKCGLANTRRTDNRDNDRRRLIIRSSIDKRYMKTRLVLFYLSSSLTVCTPSRFWSKCLLVG